jgi:hypothetical protein
MGPLRLPFAAAALLLATAAHAATYYVSPAGDDGHDGRSPAAAWRTAAKVEAAPLAPGDTVLFARGGAWHEQLKATASGAAGHPITYDAYGTGERPKFWGSDPIPPTAFEPLDGAPSAYRVAEPAAVHCVFADHHFLRGSAFSLGTNGNPNNDPATNIAHVKVTPGTYFMSTDGYLYVNTAGVDPRAGKVSFTAVFRDDVVSSNGKDHLVFRNLVADETADWDMGYGMRVMGSADVRLEHCAAYRCGKHHFAAINSTGFVGLDLYAAEGMDELGYGQATAYVAYSDESRHGDASQWVDCTVEHYPGQLGAFYTHGLGIGRIDIRHMVSRGNWIAMGTDGPGEVIELRQTVIENGRLVLYGSHILVDGLTMTGGGDGSLNVGGDGDVVQNCVIASAGQSTIHDAGHGTQLLFNTLVLRGDDVAIHLDAKATGTTIRGNIVAGTNHPLRVDGTGPFTADHNVYAGSPVFVLDGKAFDFAAWQAAGHDAGSVAVADAGMVDPAGGNYTLKPHALARHRVPTAGGLRDAGASPAK